MRVVAHCTGCVSLQGSHASTWAAARPSLAQTRSSFQQVRITSAWSAPTWRHICICKPQSWSFNFSGPHARQVVLRLWPVALQPPAAAT